LGNVIDPVDYIEKYGAEALRYFLLREVPTTGDGDFSKVRFETVYSSELANNLGNLFSRVVTMAGRYSDNKAPKAVDAPSELKSLLDDVLQNYHRAFEDFDLKSAIEQTIKLLDFANKYVEEKQPWILAKEDMNAVYEVLYVLLEVLRYAALLLAPFIPKTSEEMVRRLGLTAQDLNFAALEWGRLKEGNVLEKGEALFPRLDVSL